MRIRLAAIAIAASACAEPVVELELRLPSNADTFDASCVSAVSVMVTGSNIASDINDYTWQCQEISSQPRISGVRDEIRGKFKIDVPSSGLSGIELFGFSGPQPCAPPEFVSPDLIFHAAAGYIGQDTIQLPVQTTLDCTRNQVKVRPLELFKLVGGATPSATNCAAAAVTDAMGGYATLGTIMGRPFSPGVDFWGGFRSADVVGGVAAFSAATSGNNDSCIAYDTGSEMGFGTACTVSGYHVCAGADEIDAPFVDGNIERESLALDESLMSKWDARIFVSVWDNGSPKRPLAGARVEIAATDGAVIYVDPPAAGSVQLTKRTDNQTGPSGLAVVYTNKLANVKVTTAAGDSRDVTVAAPDWSVGAALVVMSSGPATP